MISTKLHVWIEAAKTRPLNVDGPGLNIPDTWISPTTTSAWQFLRLQPVHLPHADDQSPLILAKTRHPIFCILFAINGIVAKVHCRISAVYVSALYTTT